MANEYKRYDSQAGFWMQNARLAKDPQVIEGGEKPMVKLTFVLTSRSDRHEDTWVEVTVNDRQSDLAAALQKGDVIGFAGFPATRVWGDPPRTSFEVVRAELYPSIDLIVKLKDERGWEPGAGVKAKGGKAAPKKGKFAAKGKRRPVEDIDEDDEDLDAED